METPAPAKPKARVREIAVTVITERGHSALVEWMDGGDKRRGYVPAEAVAGGKCAEDVLKAAHLYGVAWEKYIEIKATPTAVAQALRGSGIWTIDDLTRNPGGAQSAINSVVGISAGMLRKIAMRGEGG